MQKNIQLVDLQKYMIKETTIVLPKNTWKTIPKGHFFHATDGKIATQKTAVKIKHDNQYLYVEFECLDDPFVNENTYLEYNSEMYNQEVFEIFIATGKEIPKKYIEIEINPNNALFVARIENETGEAPTKLDFIDQKASGIMHGIQKGKERWNGFMTIPFALIGHKSDHFRLNFYRIISKKSQPNPDWKCDASNCDFTCWSATLSGDTPRFHRPEAFGELILK